MPRACPAAFRSCCPEYAVSVLRVWAREDGGGHKRTRVGAWRARTEQLNSKSKREVLDFLGFSPRKAGR
jgi:hypothetical protein